MIKLIDYPKKGGGVEIGWEGRLRSPTNLLY